MIVSISLTRLNICHYTMTKVVNAISVLPKIQQPNPKSKYRPMYCTGMDEDVYTFRHYGKAM